MCLPISMNTVADSFAKGASIPSEDSIWENPGVNRRASVPRHREVNAYTAMRICKQLDIPQPH